MVYRQWRGVLTRRARTSGSGCQAWRWCCQAGRRLGDGGLRVTGDSGKSGAVVQRGVGGVEGWLRRLCPIPV